jgi:Putative auto-transporter adhesin, head GIN domain
MPRLLLAGLIAVGLPAAATAETLNRSLDGTQLQLRLSCVKSVEIAPSADLQGKVEINAEAESADELKPLALDGGAVAKIERRGDCHSHEDEPTLTLSIKVPSAMPIDLRDSGSGDYQIGAVGGPLKIVLAGSGDVRAERASNLDLEVAGSGNLDLDRLEGPGKIDVRGSGDVKIGEGTMPSLEISLRGSGSVNIGDAQIDKLVANIAGSGDIDIGGKVADAKLSTVGSGDISIAKATGKIEKSRAGSGSINVGD